MQFINRIIPTPDKKKPVTRFSITGIDYGKMISHAYSFQRGALERGLGLSVQVFRADIFSKYTSKALQGFKYLKISLHPPEG